MKPAARVQSGMVLVAVLWMVAALSIIVAGISRSARDEARVVARLRGAVTAQALGDAAIQLALQALAARPALPAGAEQLDISFQGAPIAVEIMPLNGLIDLNAAQPALLAGLYQFAGGLPQQAALALAQATLEARNRRDAKGAPVRFEAPEDLLQVPGIDYDLYARLAGLVTADLRGSGKVNPLAAPVGVLAVLAGGDSAKAAQIAASRAASGQASASVDTTALDAAHIDRATTRRLRVLARVPLADGGWQVVFRHVDLTRRSRDGMPWHTFHSGRTFEPAARTDL